MEPRDIEKRAIILHEDTVWKKDVLLGEGNVVSIVSGKTLTIQGTPKKPVRVVFQSTKQQSAYQPSDTPYISVFPSATLIMEHVILESTSPEDDDNNDTGGGFSSKRPQVHSKSIGVAFDKDSVVRASHVTCQNLMSCFAGTGDAGFDRKGFLMVQDSVFSHTELVLNNARFIGNITRSLFVNNDAISYFFFSVQMEYEVTDSIFLNNSNVNVAHSLTGSNGLEKAKWVNRTWFLNNTIGATLGLAPSAGMQDCVFYGNDIGLSIVSGGYAFETVENLTFIDNKVGIQAAVWPAKKEFEDAAVFARINLIHNTNYSFVSKSRDAMNPTHLYWGGTNMAAIQASILDISKGDTDAGIVNIDPIATEPFAHSLYSTDRKKTIQLPTSFQGKSFSYYQQQDATTITATLPNKIQWNPTPAADKTTQGDTCPCTLSCWDTTDYNKSLYLALAMSLFLTLCACMSLGDMCVATIAVAVRAKLKRVCIQP